MDVLQIAKNMNMRHNVTFRVLDASTMKVVQEYSGHNQATNSLLLGIAHYLKGDGVLNQGSSMLSQYVPRYISLGTMGLINQDEDDSGLPTGIGVSNSKSEAESDEEFEIRRFQEYMDEVPGYGADGYDPNQNNGRMYAGLGPAFKDRESNTHTIRCELISDTFPRSPITYRNIVPEVEAELPETIDVVFGAMISTGALAQFREPGKDYVYITEAGLWSEPKWVSGGQNGLLAGYRIVPPDSENWDMTIPENREILKKNIIRVGINQVVQVIWKIQIGSVQNVCNHDYIPQTKVSYSMASRFSFDEEQIGELEIISREYSAGSEGMQELASDLSMLLDWDINNSPTFYKGTMSTGHFVGLMLTQGTNFARVKVLCQQGSTSCESNFGTDMSESSLETYSANIVKWSNGFSLCFTRPVSGTAYNNSINIGACKCTNSLTGAEGWCTFGINTYGFEQGVFIASDSTYNSTRFAFECDDDGTTDFSVIQPFYCMNTPDIPNDLYLIRRYESERVQECGYCTFGGRRYYKNGCLMIPTD